MTRFSLALVCAALAVAGCGTVHKPAHTAGVHRADDSNPAAARADARHLLSLLVLPAGAIRSSGGPPRSLRKPAERAATPNLVDLHRWWRAKGSLTRAYAFIESHVPHGSKRDGVGSEGQRGTTQMRFVTFSWPSPYGFLGQRWLVVDVVALPHGYSGVRADAQVIWVKPRPTGERVPASARVLTVTRGWLGHNPSLSFTTTNGAKVDEIAAMLNRLQIDQPGVTNCPAMRAAPTVTFTFRASRHGPALARASLPSTGPDGECPGIAFKLHGATQPALYALPSFLRQAGHILGVTLFTK